MSIAIQFGAGNIGRGFIGYLLFKSGFEVIFADVNQQIIDEINKKQNYKIIIKDIDGREEIINKVSAVSSLSENIIDKMLNTKIITTAVGPNILKNIAPTLAKAIKRRKEENIKDFLNIIACENSVNASEVLKNLILEQLNEEEKIYLNKFVGFPNCSVDRIVPPFESEDILDTAVEKFYEWNVEEKGFKGEIPEIFGMNLVNDLLPYIERKLFTLNTGHAVTAYLSLIKGYKTIYDGINDKKIQTIVRNCMIESGNALIKKHNFNEEEHKNYIEKIITRFKNPYLNDDILRVGREPIRKLSENDRLFKPLNTAIKYNINVENLLIGIASALYYYNEDDKQSIELKNLLKEIGVKNTIKKISNFNNDNYLNIIENNYKNIKNIL